MALIIYAFKSVPNAAKATKELSPEAILTMQAVAAFGVVFVIGALLYWLKMRRDFRAADTEKP